MSEAREPHGADRSARRAHGLGPHVVGQRVVVRYRLPDGAEAGATDVLGTCLAWEPDAIVVQPIAGGVVRVRLADVVTGKPVPERASVRSRVPARDAQVHGFALFPDLRTRPLGPWVLRDSPTATARRANSVLAFGPSGLPDDDAVAAVEWHYRRPVAAVETGTAEDALFTARGWVPESTDADTLFQVAGTAQVARALRGVESDDVALEAEAGFATARLGDPGAAEPGGVVASGIAALRDDWLGFRGIEVAHAARRRGHGLRIMAALVGWGAEQGATTCYLQVLADNAPALALYERLGFRTHHRYRYLTPGS